MSEIAFYHCLTIKVEEALFSILEKILGMNQRAVILSPFAERIDFLNQFLWEYKEDSFLPHGTKSDGFPELQPIWLTTEEYIPNKAKYLVLCDGAQTQNPEPYERVIEIFNGGNFEELESARLKWRHYKKQGFQLIYFRQTEDRNWIKQ